MIVCSSITMKFGLSLDEQRLRYLKDGDVYSLVPAIPKGNHSVPSNTCGFVSALYHTNAGSFRRYKTKCQCRVIHTRGR